MKKGLSRLLSSALSAIMLTSSLVIANPVSALAAPSFNSVGGWFEAMYAQVSGVTDSDITGVSYTGTMSGSLSGEDLQYLVRDYDGVVRIDIPGLKPGTYSLTINTSSGNLTKDNIVVQEYDRSGYAHYNYTKGVGAYNDDGTLKANAKVLYVTDENKDTVTVSSSDGTTVTGIGHILNSTGQESATVGAGLNSKGGKANNNKGILKKLADDGTPLVVRFVDEVTAPDGLTAYDSIDYGGTEGDNGFMARMQSASNVTLEGIGSNAEINGWGFHFIASTADAGTERGKSFEARNLTFWGSPEDSLGMEGQQEGSTITSPVERCWVHNCSFYPQKIANPAESDKAEGDGCCDFKRGNYMTMSYCYFKSAHKTSLIGSSDSSLQYHVTWHHNMWENCEARGPLTRNANVHIYNCYYKQQSDYCINPRANSYVFSEYNLFENCKNPVSVTSGAVKSYNDSFSACIEANDATVVTSKDTKVSTSNKYANFDTDSSVSYIPSGNYKLDESITESKKKIMAYTGVQKDTVVTPDEVNVSVIEGDRQPTASVKLPYEHNLNSSYVTGKSVTIDNVIFNVNKIDASAVSTNTDSIGQSIVFNVNEPVDITMTDGGATYPVILMSAAGEEIITGTGTATNVPAGTYFIQSSGFQPAKGTTPLKYKEAKISYLKITASDPNATTAAEPTTQATTAASSTQATTQVSTEEEPDTETTTSKPADPSGAATMGTYVFGSNASGGDFNITSKSLGKYGNVSCEFRDMTTDGAKSRKDDGNGNITFTLKSKTKVAITSSGKGMLATNEATGATYEFAAGSDIVQVLEAGTYNLEGANASSNSAISKMVLTAVDSADDTTTTTEATTETTTTTTTEATTVKTTESTTEATTTADGYKVSVENQASKVGNTITVPVKVSGGVVSAYTAKVKYDTSLLNFVKAEAGNSDEGIELDYNAADGVITIAATNANNVEVSTLFNLTFTAKAAGTAAISVSFDEIADANDNDITPAITNGSIGITDSSVTPTKLGDVDKDGDVDDKDAALLLRHISNIDVITDAVSLANADCDGVDGIDMRDVIWILNHKTSTTVVTTTTTESTTETTTTTATTTTKATTTETTTETTEATTQAPVSNGLAEGTYTLNKVNVVTDGITGIDASNIYSSDSGAIKVRGGQYLTITPAVSGTITITYSGKALVIEDANGTALATSTASPFSYNVTAGVTYRIDGSDSKNNTNLTQLVLSSNGTVATTKESTTEATTKTTTTKATETTTKTADKTTEATTSSSQDGKVNLSTPPSTKVATITSNDASALSTAISTVNKSGGTIYVDTPEINVTTALKLSGSKAGAIVGVKQSDGTYPRINFTGMASGKRGITISGSNQLIQNVIVEYAGDNGIWISGSDNKIEHVIARYNNDTGIQLSDNADSNVLRYCYSYRNCDVATYGANADGFAPKLGATNTVFEYCYSWDNADDGWDSYDKSGDNSASVTYSHSACWNNGNPKVFTGEYDYNNGNALDTALHTVKQIMAADSSFASNYANGKFDTSNGKINGKTVASWVSSAEKAMNGNGFKFGSETTAQSESVTRNANYCVSFDHKSKGFDNNNSKGCSGYFSNCLSFNNQRNYSLPYVMKKWERMFGWDYTQSNTANNTPSEPATPTNGDKLKADVYSVRDQIVSYAYANKMADDYSVNFDSVIAEAK